MPSIPHSIAAFCSSPNEFAIIVVVFRGQFNAFLFTIKFLIFCNPKVHSVALDQSPLKNHGVIVSVIDCNQNFAL